MKLSSVKVSAKLHRCSFCCTEAQLRLKHEFVFDVVVEIRSFRSYAYI